MKIRKKSEGFTLVEIMIVVVIIGLLAAMAIPAFNKVRETSQAKTCVNNLRQIASAADQYFLENGGAADVDVEADLVGIDDYIKATPDCPAGGDYDATLEPGDIPACSVGTADAESGHILPGDDGSA